MPIPTERPSLATDLQTRYHKQKVGGAYDAKNLSTQKGQRSANGGEGFGIQEAQYTQRLFRVHSADFLMQSDFKNDGKDLSIFVKGLDNTQYDHRAK